MWDWYDRLWLNWLLGFSQLMEKASLSLVWNFLKGRIYYFDTIRWAEYSVSFRNVWKCKMTYVCKNFFLTLLPVFVSVLFCFALFCFFWFVLFVLFRFVSFRFVSFRFVSFSFVLFCFVFALFLFLFFFLTPFGNLPPAGKLHRSGEEMQTPSSLSLTITLPSETNSYCTIASRTSTTTRSKYQ